MRQHAKGEIAVSDGLAEGALLLGFLCIDMNPLMVERCVGKHINAFLTELYVITDTQLLSFVLLKVFKRIDNYFTHLSFTIFSNSPQRYKIISNL